MDTGKRAHFEEALLEERIRIMQILDRIDISIQTSRRSGLGPQPANEPEAGAAGGAVIDDAAVAAREWTALAEVDDALLRLRNEPALYGRCKRCGKEIEATRLELLPATRYCQSHAST